VKFVLDTNHLIGVLKCDPRVRSRTDALPPEEVGIPLLALAEILYGAHRSARAVENLAAIARVRRVLPVLAVTEAIVERYAQVRASLAARGRPKGDFDLVIACTALEHGAILLTNDGALKDGDIEGLAVDDWLATEAAQ
jgi:tRNA(fMet)-specific endonuclease VapC